MIEPLRDDLRDPRTINQERYIALHGVDEACYLAWDCRTGKTRAEAGAILRRIKEKRVRKTLVIGPKKALTMSWEPELLALGFDRPSVGGGPNGYLVPLQYTPKGKTTWVAQVLRDILSGMGDDKPIVVLMNFDILERKFDERRQTRLSDLLWKWSPQDIVVDEAHMIANAGSLRTRTLRRLGRRAYFRRLLSGTPDPQCDVSFYSQYAFLQQSIFGNNKAKFLERYFIVNPFVAGRVEGNRPEMRPELEEKVFSVMDRVRTKDIFGDRPDYEITRTLHWPPQAREKYDQLARNSVLTEADDGIVVDGTHLLTKLLRFFQLCEGYLVNESTGDALWYHYEKQEAIIGDLAEIIGSGKRAVVSFVHTLDGRKLDEMIAKAYGDKRVAFVDGHTKNPEEILRLFDVNCTTDTELQVLVVQESVGGVGISLARAEHLLFAGWSMDSAAHEQMRKRVWDPSRPACIAYYKMADSADTFRYAVVKNKRAASVMMRELPWLDVVYGRGL